MDHIKHELITSYYYVEIGYKKSSNINMYKSLNTTFGQVQRIIKLAWKTYNYLHTILSLGKIYVNITKK